VSEWVSEQIGHRYGAGRVPEPLVKYPKVKYPEGQSTVIMNNGTVPAETD